MHFQVGDTGGKGFTIGSGRLQQAKTHLAEMIRLHGKEPDKRSAGLVVDAYGTCADFVRDECLAAGRIQDYYEISLTSGVKYNPLARPDLSAPALAIDVADVITRVADGSSHSDPFWQQETKDLATQVIRTVRLAQKREPTFLDLYHFTTSQYLFRSQLDLAALTAMDEAAAAEYEALRFWLCDKLDKLDPKLRASIAAVLTAACALFDVDEVRETFCPASGEEGLGFEELIARGQIVYLCVPYVKHWTAARIVAEMARRHFDDAAAKAGRGRQTFFFAEPEHMEGVGVAKLGNEHSTGQLLTNLRTKIWLSAEDQ